MKFAWVLGLGLVACSPVKGTPPGGDVDGPLEDCEANTCECTAATEEADCGAHSFCNEEGAGRLCDCVSGYAKDGASCVFSAAPLDKGFNQPDKWLPIDATSLIDTDAIGNLDAGVGVINRVGICEFGGFRQTFAMPPRAKAEPFRLSLTHAIIDSDQTLSGGVDVAIGGAWFESASIRNSFKTDAVCLGSRGYDGDKDFLVQTTGNVLCAGTSNSTYAIDQISIIPATTTECPVDGEAVNGNFDVQSDWSFAQALGGTGVFQATGGEGNSASARLAQGTQCSTASMTGSLAMNDHITHPNQAVEVFMNGTTGGRIVVSLGGKEIGSIFGTGSGKKYRICAPNWAHGTHQPITFTMQATNSGTCGTAIKAFTFDSVKVVDEPNCPDVDISDLGFERIANATGPATAWGLRNDFNGTNEGGLADILNTAIAARTGTGSLRLSSINQCTSDVSARTAFVVPPASGVNGPAVKLFAKVATTNVETSTAVTLFSGNRAVVAQDLPENNVYAQSIVCIPPNLIGRRLMLQLAMRNTDGSQSCTNNIPQELAFFDDLEITTDSSCAAN